MNINRHNYEEFFLLYVDNELSALERNAVELFVQQNPDLGKELRLLQQTIITDDGIVFDDKKNLLKDGSLALQEKLLLFADDELLLEERQQVAALLATDSAAAAEWNILQKTKLQPDTSIVFEDKKSLYRTEGGRIIAFKWWRAAAAIILLGLGIWFGMNVFKAGKKSADVKEESIANGKPNQQPQITKPLNPAPVQPSEKENSSSQTVNSTSPQKEQVQSPDLKNLAKVNENNKAAKDKVAKQNNAPHDNNNVVKEDNNNKKPGNNLPKPILENVNKPGSNKNDVVIVQPKTTDNSINIQPNLDNKKNDVVSTNPLRQSEKVKTVVDTDINAATNPVAKTAGYNETEEDKNDTKILYMNEDKLKGTKVGGFLRRLKRVVERTTNIKTGNSVKVAGFEIAIK